MLRPFTHPVACSWMLLRVVAQSLKPVKLISQQLPTFLFFLWSPKRSATMLDPFARFFQHCRGHARSLRMDYKDLRVVFFPRCTAGPKLVGSCCWLVFLPTTVYSFLVCIFFPNWCPQISNGFVPWLDGFWHFNKVSILFYSCCTCLHTTANTHSTTPNIVGATMLEVVAPVCTQPKWGIVERSCYVLLMNLPEDWIQIKF